MGKKWLLLGMFTALMVVGDVRGVHAMAAGCNTTLLNCYQAAANIDSFWYRWAAGLDCEFAYVECTRQTLFGA